MAKKEYSPLDLLKNPDKAKEIRSGEAELVGDGGGILGIGSEGGLLGTGILSDNGRAAARRAEEAQREATDKALGVQERMYQQQREDLEPWREAGESSLGSLMGMLPETSRAFGQDDFEADPGYQFRLEEGQRAIQNAASARGGRTSSRTLRDLVGFNQGMASNEYNNAYNRFNQNQSKRFNQYASTAGLGQTSVGQLVQAGGNYGNNVSNLYSNMGNSIAASHIAQGQMGNQLTGALLTAGGYAAGGYLGGMAAQPAAPKPPGNKLG